MLDPNYTKLIHAYSTCQQHIDFFAEKAGRNTRDITLLVVTKSQPAHFIRALHHAGQCDFGENYVQEALEKISELKDLPLTWHFIGRIQRNKTQLIAEHFDWVHSIDSAVIATRLNEARVQQKKSPLNVCVQINIDEDSAKSGISVERAETLLRHILTLPHLRLRGLMILPKAQSDREITLLSFLKAKILFDDFNQIGIQLDTLSMGMSEDMEQAIAAGSTVLRIGRIIFGD